MLRNSNLSVKSIARALDFRNTYYFSKLFAKKTGIPPSKWRSAGQNQSNLPRLPKEGDAALKTRKSKQR